MSLLLEALKKAELAKQETASAGEDANREIRLQPRAPRADGEAGSEAPALNEGSAEDARWREGPFEDAAAASPRSSRYESVAGSEAAGLDPPPEALSRSGPEERSFAEREPARAEASAAEERNAARQIFEAKDIAYNPKRNFYIVIGSLLAAGAGYAGYVWWQLQPRPYPSGPVAANVTAVPAAAPQAAEAVRAPALAAPAPAPIVPAPIAPSPREQASPAPAPSAEKAPPPAAAAPAPATRETVFKRRLAPVAARASGPATPARAPASLPERRAAPSIAINRPTLGVDPVIEDAYEAYQRGDLVAALAGYQQALRREPLNRDALLGLAAIDVRARNFDTAEARYLRLLELDPRDVAAQAGLMSLRGQLDPIQSESRLKTLIAANPDSPSLYFALGNQYARQARWPDAQAAYFRALTADPENADFAFNVAVSLDQMRKPKLALEYYRSAIELSAGRPAGFDRAQAEARIRELQLPQGTLR